jgi:hypothetical protein
LGICCPACPLDGPCAIDQQIDYGYNVTDVKVDSTSAEDHDTYPVKVTAELLRSHFDRIGIMVLGRCAINFDIGHIVAIVDLLVPSSGQAGQQIPNRVYHTNLTLF